MARSGVKPVIHETDPNPYQNETDPKHYFTVYYKRYLFLHKVLGVKLYNVHAWLCTVYITNSVYTALPNHNRIVY